MRLDQMELPKITQYDMVRFYETAKTGKIVWHSTTPRCFECEPGCKCCCAPTYYFKSELKALSKEIRSRLIHDYRSGLYIPDISSGCCFHIPPTHIGDIRHGCMIYGHEPLRCQLYPYWPIIVRGKIVIMAEPLCDVFSRDQPDSCHLCFGLGKGTDVSERIEKQARIFLKKMIREAPGMIIGNVFNRADDLLCSQSILFHTHRKYETFQDAASTLFTRGRAHTLTKTEG